MEATFCTLGVITHNLPLDLLIGTIEFVHLNIIAQENGFHLYTRNLQCNLWICSFEILDLFI